MATKTFNSVFLLLLLNELCFFFATGEVHNYVFVVNETNMTKLCKTTSVLTVNDSFPGPTIRVRRGDTAFVNVYNEGSYGVTIHWHGVRQPRNPWSDGPEHITQCAIKPGTNFTYEVEFTEEEGTLWWHAHSGWARATVHGAIVILPPVGQLYPFPLPHAEEVLVLGNWFIGEIKQLVEYALEIGGDVGLESDALTINGEPGDFGNCSRDTTRRIVVEHGKTYHLRLINAASNANMFFSVAEHKLTVVGSDASYLKPIISDFVMLSPGSTLDVLLTANQTPSYYYMAARQYFTQKEKQPYDEFNTTAILEYKGDYDPPLAPSFPSTLPTYRNYSAGITFVDKFRSLANEKYPINVPKNITTQMFITIALGHYECKGSCNTSDGYGLAASLNNVSWTNPGLDILQAYYGHISGIYKTDFPNDPPMYFDFTSDDVPTNYENTVKKTKVKVLNYGEEVEIVFQGTSVMTLLQAHPMHLHGHSFYVVGSGGGNFDPENDPKTYNLIDPPYVNTISVPRLGWTTIRFNAKNPGVWLMHCHYDRHLTWGMDFVFIVKNGDTPATSIRPPPAYMPPCDISFHSSE